MKTITVQSLLFIKRLLADNNYKITQSLVGLSNQLLPLKNPTP
jgi:hypothetical protein